MVLQLEWVFEMNLFEKASFQKSEVVNTLFSLPSCLKVA